MKRLSLSLLSVGLAQALTMSSAQAATDDERYSTSDFAYCDAVMLGFYWRETVDEAKSIIGRRIGTSAEASIDTDLKDARAAGLRCEFADTGYAFEDAQAVARLWRTDIADAKTSLTEKVSTGDRWLADQAVTEARAQQRPVTKPRSQPTPRSAPADSAEEASLRAYGASAYEYCDALLLSSVWGESIDDAKASIGRKLQNNNEAALISDLNVARSRGNRCTFQDSGFSYSDADAVARLWGTSVAEAKSELAEKVSLGERRLANQVIRDALNTRSGS